MWNSSSAGPNGRATQVSISPTVSAWTVSSIVVKSAQSVRSSRWAVGCESPRGGEEACAGLIGHVVIGDDQRDRPMFGVQVLETDLRRRGRPFGDDLVVVAVAAADRLEERRARRILVVDDEDDGKTIVGFGHEMSPWAHPGRGPVTVGTRDGSGRRSSPVRWATMGQRSGTHEAPEYRAKTPETRAVLTLRLDRDTVATFDAVAAVVESLPRSTAPASISSVTSSGT